MRKLLSAILVVALAAALVPVLPPGPRKADAFTRTESTGGSMTVSTTAQGGTTTLTYPATPLPVGSYISSFPLRARTRPAYNGSPSSNDRVSLSYTLDGSTWTSVSMTTVDVDNYTRNITDSSEILDGTWTYTFPSNIKPRQIRLQVTAGSTSYNGQPLTPNPYDSGYFYAPLGRLITALDMTVNKAYNWSYVWGRDRYGNGEYTYVQDGYPLTRSGWTTMPSVGSSQPRELRLYRSDTRDTYYATGVRYDDGRQVALTEYQTLYVDIPTVTIVDPPYQPGKPSLTALTSPLRLVQSGSPDTWAYTPSPSTWAEWTAPQQVLGAKIRVENFFGYAYVEGWNGSTWVSLVNWDYRAHGTREFWLDLRRFGTITKLRTQMYTHWGTLAPVLDVPEVYYTWPTTGAVSTGGSLKVTYPWTYNAGYWSGQSPTWYPPQRVVGVRLKTRALNGAAYVEGFDPTFSEWRRINAPSSGDTDFWYDVRDPARPTFLGGELSMGWDRLYTYLYSNGYYGQASVDVPEVYYSWPGWPAGTSTAPPPPQPPGTYQAALAWWANAIAGETNPPGTSYEVWRKTLNSSGTVVLDERVYTTTGTGPFSWTTTDQVAGKYYRYRIRAIYGTNQIDSAETSYWTAPIPTVTGGTGGGLTISWSPVGPGFTYIVSWERDDGVTQELVRTTGTSATASTSQLSPQYKYKITVRPLLSEGGIDWPSSDGQWYSPLWQAPGTPAFSNVTQTGVTVTWTANGIPSGQTYVLRRETVTGSPSAGWTPVPGSLVERYRGTGLSFTDSGLAAGTAYRYSVVALNALAQEGAKAEAVAMTAPSTPANVSLQYGTKGWDSVQRNWAELAWDVVPTATQYRVRVTAVALSQEFIVAAPTGSATRASWRLDDSYATLGNNWAFQSGYAFTVRAENTYSASPGQSPYAPTLNATYASRTDTTAPTGTVLINEGAPSTSGARVQVKVTGRDAQSGPWSVQLSNDGTTWSAAEEIQPTANRITATGADAYLTSLAGWYSPSGIWTDVIPDAASEHGGRVARIRWDKDTAQGQLGLQMARNAPVIAGKTYTLTIRYKVAGLTMGTVGVWGAWTNAAGSTVASAARMLPTGSEWQTQSFTDVAPTGAAGRSITLGFDRANTGATLFVDWIALTEGSAAAASNALASPATNVFEWTLDTATTGKKTVYARVLDVLGNISSALQQQIQYMLADLLAPRVTMTINGGASSTDSQSVRLEVVAIDDQSSQQLLRARYSNDGVSWSAWETYTPSRTWTLSPGEGQKRVWVEVQDAAGNIGGTIASIYYRLNLAPVANPAVFWPMSGAPGTYSTGSGTLDVQFVRLSEVTVAWDLASLGSVQTVRYAFDPRLQAPWETIAATRTFALPPTQGITTLYGQLDTGQTFSIRWVVDTLAPVVRAFWRGGATVTETGGLAYAVIEAEDNVAAPEDLLVSVNGAPWVPWAPEMPVTLAGSGTKTVTIRVSDPAGNTVTKTLTIYALP